MIPQNEREEEFLKRIQTIEKRIFRGNTFENHYGESRPEKEGEAARN